MQLFNLQRFFVVMATHVCIGVSFAASVTDHDPTRDWAAVLAPADSQLPVPEIHYNSSFQGYQPFADPTVGNWKTLNKTVGEVGGWKAYAQEAREPDTSAPRPHGGKP